MPNPSTQAGFAPRWTFTEFMQHKEALLASHPNKPIDLTDNRFALAVTPWRPGPSHLTLPAKAHRCHLAEWWLEAFHLPAEWKPRALICIGVRQALKTMMEQWALQKKVVLIPLDVYPVYHDIARNAGATFRTFATHPSVPSILPAGDVLLVTNPLKPRASALTRQEVDALLAWLHVASHRRLIIDAVYTLDTCFDTATLALYATGQVIVLHSLSKSWAHPLVMGVALMPENDVPTWSLHFKAQSPSPYNLTLAQALLTQAPLFPLELAATLAEAKARLLALCTERQVPLLDSPPQLARYHFIVPLPWQHLLASHGILGLPFSVFGGANMNLTIITSLSLL
ncbi:MAG: aminotransferase class I/II-fold pyridoxal phosphate-dependent enzyme [Agitococcus sp.]|nr:aminotransferase class I/II-fold pyridoxal phosphate-dependent enzyme [Agitococcus sp.]